MTEPFTHAIPNASVRRLIAEQLTGGADPAEVAAQYDISVATAQRYRSEFEGARRKALSLNDFEREAIRAGVARGARKRYEREYTAAVVRQVLGEE